MLLYFYGLECPHCRTMHPLIEKFEKEFNLKVTKFETWHNEANAHEEMKYDTGLCGGVPFFYNTENKKSLCGESTYEELKDWAGV